MEEFGLKACPSCRGEGVGFITNICLQAGTYHADSSGSVAHDGFMQSLQCSLGHLSQAEMAHAKWQTEDTAYSPALKAGGCSQWVRARVWDDAEWQMGVE